MKTCSKCRQAKPLTEFFVSRRKKDGLQERCKECHRAGAQKIYARYDPSLVQTAREQGVVKTCTQCGEAKPVTDFFTHKGMSDGFRPDCKACLLEKQRAQTKRDGVKIAVRRANYAQRNAAAIRVAHQQAHQRRSQDPEWLAQKRARAREYDRAHPVQRALTQQRRLARLAGASINDFTAEQWEAIKMSYGFRCAYCGAKPSVLTLDHVIPLSRGGPHTARNIVPSCLPCNTRKGNRSAPPFHVIPISFVG